MIDIHNHILPCVDDGSSDIDTSIFLLKEASKQGINKIICTPHFMEGLYDTNLKNINEAYDKIISKANELNIELFLGQEVMCIKPNDLLELIPSHQIIPLANSRYFLLEFNYSKYVDISEAVYNASLYNYGAIIAHIERYEYIDIKEVRYLKQIGALIQVNAESIVKPFNFRIRRLIKKLLDEDLIDFVSSDIHQNRVNYMLKAFNKIQKKYGVERANILFNENAEKYLLNLK